MVKEIDFSDEFLAEAVGCSWYMCGKRRKLCLLREVLAQAGLFMFLEGAVNGEPL